MRFTLSFALVALTSSFASADSPLLFEKDVRPILKQHCVHCHGEEPNPRGKLDVRTVKMMLKGGRTGPAIVPGKTGDSLLWSMVESDEMPKGHKKVPAHQKTLLKQWIEQGARTARAEPDNPNDARFTEEELSHWAWQPVRKPTTPTLAQQSHNPIDAFLLAKLRQKGIAGFSPEADRLTLLRRVTFDLTGLPPTLKQIDEFLADQSPSAYEKLIDRLLASPEYGQRWGRHWLDVAGYAETDGGPGQDTERPHAWRYRDYVIRSFNEDKPYDQFVREQLAGDELAARPWKLDDARTLDTLTATGFLRMAPDPTQTTNTIQERNQSVADTLKIVTSTLLGLSVGCAQCHDHKYDPISTQDYYRLRALFDPAFNLQTWKTPAQRLLDTTPKAVLERIAASDAEIMRRTEALNQRKEAAAKVVFEREIGRVPEADRGAARKAVETPEDKRTAEQKALLEKYPNVKPVSFIVGFFVEYDPKLHAEFKAEDGKIAETRAKIPPRQQLMVAVESGPPPVSQVHFRGDPEQPKATVTPGELAVLERQKALTIPTPAKEAASSGRRQTYAQWLTSGTHPLTARVFVNRLWLHHFGKGLVGTPNDFGLNGDRPTHPELLDWLAAEFVEQGWKIKGLHKQMLLSQAYRQVARRNAERDRIDPDNRLLGRMSLRRLEAEAVRDAVLAASGKLNRQLGGPSIPVAEDGEGKAVFGRRKENEGLFSGIEALGEDEFRRSVYVQSRRALPLAMLEAFDLPVMTPNCDARRFSTVAPQSLFFLNDQFMVEQANEMSERLFREANDTQTRIHLAFRLLFATPPSEAQQKACQEFLTRQTAYFQSNGDANWQATVKKWPHAPELRATAALCQTLMCSNRFLYVD